MVNKENAGGTTGVSQAQLEAITHDLGLKLKELNTMLDHAEFIKTEGAVKVENFYEALAFLNYLCLNYRFNCDWEGTSNLAKLMMNFLEVFNEESKNVYKQGIRYQELHNKVLQEYYRVRMNIYVQQEKYGVHNESDEESEDENLENSPINMDDGDGVLGVF